MNLPQWCQTHSLKEFFELYNEKGSIMNDEKNKELVELVPKTVAIPTVVEPDTEDDLPPWLNRRNQAEQPAKAGQGQPTEKEPAEDTEDRQA